MLPMKELLIEASYLDIKDLAFHYVKILTCFLMFDLFVVTSCCEYLLQFPVFPGRQYLADAVVLRAVDPAASGGAVWESLWAALTFATPK